MLLLRRKSLHASRLIDRCACCVQTYEIDRQKKNNFSWNIYRKNWLSFWCHGWGHLIFYIMKKKNVLHIGIWNYDTPSPTRIEANVNEYDLPIEPRRSFMCAKSHPITYRMIKNNGFWSPTHVGVREHSTIPIMNGICPFHTYPSKNIGK